jgi:hypothetical protein
LVLELRFILDAVIARQATQYFVALPVVEDPGHVLARDAGHGSEIVPPDLLANDDPARPDFLPKMFRQLEHGPGDPAFERKEGCRRDRSSRRKARACIFASILPVRVPSAKAGRAGKLMCQVRAPPRLVDLGVVGSRSAVFAGEQQWLTEQCCHAGVGLKTAELGHH